MTNQTDSSLLDLPDQAATEHVAAVLARHVQIGDVVALWGDLGAGKSTFARAFVRTLTSPLEDVPSPTFTLVQTYDPAEATLPPIWHFDLYRLEDPEEALALDMDDAFSTAVSLIEWPDRLGGFLPADRLDLCFHHPAAPDGPDHRELRLNARGKRWQTRLVSFLSDMK